MRAYVQQLLERDASYLSFEQVAYWFGERGYEVIRFDYPQIDDGFLDHWLLKYPDETIVAGGVKTIREVLSRAGRPAHCLHDLPECLKPWIGRKFWSTTFGKIQLLVESKSPRLPLHIKPLLHEKLFTGMVIRNSHELNRLGEVNDTEPILAQEPVSFVSEWRAYVLRDRIVHVGRYRGDCLLFPDPVRMNGALTAFKNAPVAFSMDWGVTSDGETLLVEINDATALGNYGLDGKTYTSMIEARWQELATPPS